MRETDRQTDRWRAEKRGGGGGRDSETETGRGGRGDRGTETATERVGREGGGRRDRGTERQRRDSSNRRPHQEEPLLKSHQVKQTGMKAKFR